ncbi:hypothetical protein HN014_19675 [Aquimarina sp. TRL1]|uniref:type IV pili methyl-accepting chemotaxis transducer N-terminal domain-containing protein n=1 Tax=Aquimarina sp. (strain TRL1) TaxID=2736252 RepID=UPI00158B8C86|nr:type IV pili methyl-accepting chemotaxis transducer N-terminal domain-containing protein [Aquimarina sp. TRL1]QKX07037.1 hypothetical protein HN014_19675 [Aquimarina sp. TRL1]
MKLTLAPNKKIQYLLIISLVFLGTSISAQLNTKYGSLTYHNAVNVAGKQRMLSQKMSKAYLFLLSKPNAQQAKKDLLSSQIIFEEQNRVLLQNARSKRTKDRIEVVNQMWTDFKKLIESTPNYENAKKIIDTNTDLLQASNAVVLSIISDSKESHKNISNELEKTYSVEDELELNMTIDISGRQRMLSQRLAFYYYANQIALKDKNSDQMLTNVFHELDGSINKLLISKFNTPQIDEKIGLAFSKWNSIKKNRLKLMDHGFDVNDIYKISNELTSVFNEITVLYEKVKL